MPVNSRDVQYGAAIGFVVIVGIVAIQFGFNAKLVLALLAGLGILFCASVFEGLVRAAMVGVGTVLLVFVAYDLATSCDSACQQTRAEAARQRAAQEQAQLAADQQRQLAQTTEIQYCNGRKIEWTSEQICQGSPSIPQGNASDIFGTPTTVSSSSELGKTSD